MTLDDERFKGPDFRPSKRVKNPKVAKKLHAKGCTCVLNCGKPGQTHHVLPKGSMRGDDVPENLVCLCGEHHAAIHANDVCVRTEFGDYLLLERPDVVTYIRAKMGDESGAEWLSRKLFIR